MTQDDTSRRVLVVDDEPNVRETFRLMFSTLGYDVEAVGNGKEAMARVHRRAPDLVITDVFMPEKDGLETIRDLRASHPSLKIIAITGGGVYGLTDLTAIAERLGADEAFMKPVDMTELAEAARRLLHAEGNNGV